MWAPIRDRQTDRQTLNFIYKIRYYRNGLLMITFLNKLNVNWNMTVPDGNCEGLPRTTYCFCDGR